METTRRYPELDDAADAAITYFLQTLSDETIQATIEEKLVAALGYGMQFAKLHPENNDMHTITGMLYIRTAVRYFYKGMQHTEATKIC